MIQMIKFTTWSRTINGIPKESIIDHVYTNDSSNIENIYKIIPDIGDHNIIILQIMGAPTMPSTHLNEVGNNTLH